MVDRSEGRQKFGFLEILAKSQVELLDVIEQLVETNLFLEIAEYEESEEIHEDEEADEELVSYDIFDDDNVPVYLPSKEYREYHTVDKPSLKEHLVMGLHLLEELDETDLAIGEYIIYNLDDRGFITIPLENIAKRFNVDTDKVGKVLISIQEELDPPGIAARNAMESLLIQLRRLGVKDDLPYLLVERYLPMIGSDTTFLARLLNRPEEEVKSACTLLHKLTAFPAKAWQESGPPSVLPDLIIEKLDDRFDVYLNEAVIPKIRYFKEYETLIYKNELTGEEQKMLEAMQREAFEFLRNLDRRRSLLIEIGNFLVERVHQFLCGEVDLTPVMIEEAAPTLGVPVSTILYALRGKYVQTPRGIFPLSRFFTRRKKHVKSW